MKTKKLKLSDLTVKSFITSLTVSEKNTVEGGILDTRGCTQIRMNCAPIPGQSVQYGQPGAFCAPAKTAGDTRCDAALQSEYNLCTAVAVCGAPKE